MHSVKRSQKNPNKIKEQVDTKSYSFSKLFDGVKEIKPKSNFVYSKDGFDNIELDGGFTTCFWIWVDKVGPAQDASILYQWRNISEHDYRIGFKNKSIYAEIRNQYDEIETIIAETKLVPNRWNSIILRFAFESADICDAALFVNAHFDTSASITNYRPFQYISVSIGKFRKIKSFSGALTEAYVFFYPLDMKEIQEQFQQGIEEIERGGGSLVNKVLEKDDLEYHTYKFRQTHNIPDLFLIQEGKTIVKNEGGEPTDAAMNDRETIIEGEGEEMQEEPAEEDNTEAIQNLSYYFMDNELFFPAFSQIAENYEWILSVSSVMAKGEIAKDGALELPRFMRVLRFCQIKISQRMISEMIDITKTGTELLDEYDDQVKYKAVLYYYFLNIIKEVVFSDMQFGEEDVERLSVGEYSDSDDHLEEEADPEPEPEPVESEKPLATGMRKDSFHSMPDKFHKAEKPEGEDDKEKENEKEKDNKKSEHEGTEHESVAPVMTKEEEAKIIPTNSIKDNPSVNEDGLMKHEMDENLAVPEEEPEPEPEEEVVMEMEDDTDLPELDENWNRGAFEICIIRCAECYKHYEYSRHSEDEYVNEFNKIGDAIGEKFDEANIIGNLERASYLGAFDIYLRGVGPPAKRDEQGRYFIFRKKNVGRFPKPREIHDALIMLCLMYGSSVKLARAQQEFKHTYGYLIPKSIPNFTHEHPVDMPSKVLKQPDMKKVAKSGGDRVMLCKNWACGKQYNEDKNEKHSCLHHPGVYQFGSKYGLWPESWSCCRGDWYATGCRRGYHRGQPKDKFFKLCINHGEPNPDSVYPDSFCGKPFTDPEKKPEWQMTEEDKEALNQCFIHPGHLKFDKRSGTSEWTCCSEGPEAEPCSQAPHKNAEYPDEEAKKYFYDKPLRPVGMAKTNVVNEFQVYGRFCGVFRETIPYNEHGKPRKPEISRDEQKKLDAMDKVCTNWACGKTFKEENNHKKACRCHPGRWDFGNSARKCSKPDLDERMWEPHWTCCRGEWESTGCRRRKHRGVFADIYPEVKREFDWPDTRAQTYFKKKVSLSWKHKMEEKYDLDEDALMEKVQKYENYYNRGGAATVRELEDLGDYLGLHLLCDYGEMSYHYKFEEVINGEAQKYLDDGNGDIDKAKFLKWWYMTTEELLHKNDPPPEEPPVEEAQA